MIINVNFYTFSKWIFGENCGKSSIILQRKWQPYWFYVALFFWKINHNICVCSVYVCIYDTYICMSYVEKHFRVRAHTHNEDEKYSLPMYICMYIHTPIHNKQEDDECSFHHWTFVVVVVISIIIATCMIFLHDDDDDDVFHVFSLCIHIHIHTYTCTYVRT